MQTFRPQISCAARPTFNSDRPPHTYTKKNCAPNVGAQPLFVYSQIRLESELVTQSNLEYRILFLPIIKSLGNTNVITGIQNKILIFI